MSVPFRTRFRAYLSDHLMITAIALLRALTKRIPAEHLPSALAEPGHHSLFGASRTRLQAFDSGFTAGYFTALSEVTQVEQQLLVCSLLQGHGDKEHAATLRKVVEAAATWASLK